MIADTTEIDRQIAESWPDKWAKANDPTRRGRSKARSNLRSRWRHHLAFEAFKLAHPGARCGGCEHRETIATVLGGQPFCSVHSDYHGYQMVREDGLCMDFDQRQ